MSVLFGFSRLRRPLRAGATSQPKPGRTETNMNGTIKARKDTTKTLNKQCISKHL